jgi:hypothetical protein
MQPGQILQPNNEGNTILHLAALAGHEVLTEVLSHVPAGYASLSNHSGCLPIHLAVANPDFLAFEMLASRTSLSELGAQTNGGKTALFCAVENHRDDYAKVLIKLMLPEQILLKDKTLYGALEVLEQRRSFSLYLLIARRPGVSFLLNTSPNREKSVKALELLGEDYAIKSFDDSARIVRRVRYNLSSGLISEQRFLELLDEYVYRPLNSEQAAELAAGLNSEPGMDLAALLLCMGVLLPKRHSTQVPPPLCFRQIGFHHFVYRAKMSDLWKGIPVEPIRIPIARCQHEQCIDNTRQVRNLEPRSSSEIG